MKKRYYLKGDVNLREISYRDCVPVDVLRFWKGKPLKFLRLGGFGRWKMTTFQEGDTYGIGLYISRIYLTERQLCPFTEEQ